jgi:hypothetical protein
MCLCISTTYLWRARVCRDRKMEGVMQVDHTRRIAKSLWNSCWRDSRRCFGHQRLGFSQRGLLDILRTHQVLYSRDSEGGSGGVGIDSVGNSGAIPRITIVPRDPSKKLSIENSAILTKTQHRLLMRVWNSCRDDGVYREVLANLLQSSTATL